jgi:3-oxoacyl-[acyl-carrier protein] reductase
MSDMTGLNAMVVGGGGEGIGRAVSTALAAAGATVGVVDLELDRAATVCALITANGGKARPFAGNVIDSDDADAVTGSVWDELGGLDVAVMVVGGVRGLAPWQRAHFYTDEQWQAVLDLNLGYVFLVTRSVVKRLVEHHREGALVAIGSVSGMNASPNHFAYGVGKAGVIHLAKSIAVEYGRDGIRMNTVSPGRVRTPVTKDTLGADAEEQFKARIPLGRVAEPEDIADAVVFLSSPQSRYISGQNLVVDGGAMARFPMPLPGSHPSEAI